MAFFIQEDEELAVFEEAQILTLFVRFVPFFLDWQWFCLDEEVSAWNEAQMSKIF